ncbi:HNH endonuclease signature motif containing protein [Cellulomonas alba]|uniref:DUF222 domain-containing protein n=1 Tax=Cellulomonas alba TaxID=3053467 RepID=A0ABT7SHN2_9CELL|nr:HNH endonuclease signature motif containing protein [Cellulomonas alba]MDM7855695.1 DUF222 domain-containing protein [Cellulomonas alba]
MYESAASASAGDAALRAAERAGSLDDAELVRAVADLEAAGRRLDTARVRVAAEVAHRSRRDLGGERLSARLGCRTASEAVQRLTGVAGATAGQRIRLGLATREDRALTGGRLPARFDAVGAALRAGSLGVDGARAIVAALEPTLRVAPAEHVAAAERELVASAVERWGSGGEAEGDATGAPDTGTDLDTVLDTDTADDPRDDAPDGTSPRLTRTVPVLDADAIRLQARVWAEYLDPDGAAPDERDDERRFLTLHAARRGLVPVSGLLLPEVAATLRRYAEAWTSPRTAPVPDPTTCAGERARGCDQASSLAAQEDAASSPAGKGSPPPRAEEASVAEPAAAAETRSRAQILHDVLATAITVATRVVDAPSVAGNAPTLVVVARADDLQSSSGVAHSEDGGAVRIDVARHLGCAGAIQRVSVDGAGRIVGLWSPDRCFTGAQRRAIAVRDGGCVIPGCSVPPAWCEVHHVVPHADDPQGTHTDNGVLLCWHHHRTIDRSGWRVRMAGGLPWISPPAWLDAARAWRPARPPTPPHRFEPHAVE